MKRMLALGLFLPTLLAVSTSAFAETTLEKIARTGVLTIATRTGVVPSPTRPRPTNGSASAIDLVEAGHSARGEQGSSASHHPGEEGVTPAHPDLASHLERGGPRRRVDDTTRAPGARGVDVQPDLRSWTRRQFLVPKGSPIARHPGRRRETDRRLQASTSASSSGKQHPTAQCGSSGPARRLRGTPAGAVDAYSSDGVYLAAADRPGPDSDRTGGSRDSTPMSRTDGYAPRTIRLPRPSITADAAIESGQ